MRAEADGQFTVDMGAAGGARRRCGAGGRSARSTGLAISVGNPHLACMIDQPVADVDLSDPLVLGPAELAGGANVEVVGRSATREIEMRVHERGSGLTLSCGTGAVAAAVAAAVAPASGRTGRACPGLCTYPAADWP